MISISKEELQKQVVEVTGNDNELINVVFDIVNKINNLKNGTTTSIAKLIDYKPEVSFVEPLMQGKISRFAWLVCKKIGIHLKAPDSDKKIGGLGYFNEFTKF